MRLLYLTLSLIALTFFSCQKNEYSVVLAQQYVVFSIGQVDPILLKSNDEVECHFDESGNLKIPTVAEVIINGVTYYPEVFFLNGNLYTQSLKLDLPGGNEVTYNLTRFALLETAGGEIVMATPTKGSYYASYVSTSVDFDIDVSPYKKTEVKIDVLCFVPWDSILFGFHTDDNMISQNTSQYNEGGLSNSRSTTEPLVISGPSGILPFGLSEHNDLESNNYLLTNKKYSQYSGWLPDAEFQTNQTNIQPN